MNGKQLLGAVAQLVERLNGIQEVWGSIPHRSTPPSYGPTTSYVVGFFCWPNFCPRLCPRFS